MKIFRRKSFNQNLHKTFSSQNLKKIFRRSSEEWDLVKIFIKYIHEISFFRRSQKRLRVSQKTMKKACFVYEFGTCVLMCVLFFWMPTNISKAPTLIHMYQIHTQNMLFHSFLADWVWGFGMFWLLIKSLRLVASCSFVEVSCFNSLFK